jgi:hypothetical protein
MKQTIDEVFEKTDWRLLREQKTAFVRLRKKLTGRDRALMDGMLHFSTRCRMRQARPDTLFSA